MQKHKGFTLIELLIVIGIIAILAAIIFVAVDPARRLSDARNANRWSSVNSILNAYLKDLVDKGGTSPLTLSSGVTYMIGTQASISGVTCTATSTAQMLDLGPLVSDGYLAAVPKDPSAGTDAVTGYYFNKSANGRITVGSCEPDAIGADPAPDISVRR